MDRAARLPRLVEPCTAKVGFSFKGMTATNKSGPNLNLGSMSLQNILLDDPAATTFDLKISFTSPKWRRPKLIYRGPRRLGFLRSKLC